MLILLELTREQERYQGSRLGTQTNSTGPIRSLHPAEIYFNSNHFKYECEVGLKLYFPVISKNLG